MGANWGKNLRITIFGESHGAGVGAVVDGLPPGLAVDERAIAEDMARRAPGGALASARREADAVELLSGVYLGRTTGAPLCALIRNRDARPGDYGAIARPSHADFTGSVRYRGHNDPRGGGHFSGRLTAPLVFAGALCRALLSPYGVQVGAHILRAGGAVGRPLDPAGGAGQLRGLREAPFLDDSMREAFAAEIARARAQGDSVGGLVECAAFGVPAGWGDPFFDSIESAAASLLFSIPGCKGVEFGAGFSFAQRWGSAANDSYVQGGGTATNHSGGINGGITNGMPILLRAAFRPTPTIGIEQVGLDVRSREPVAHKAGGRHDPCIALRAAPVVEAALLIALADRALEVI